jgi:isocitrate dehydrogenase (NAD+)
VSATPIVLIEGDGIGPEIVSAAARVLEATGLAIEWEPRPAGAGALERHGAVLPAQTLDALRSVGAALKGPFWTPSSGTQRSANFYLRRELDLYACVRPIAVEARGIDVLLVRENVEDLYGAIEWMATPDVAQAVKVASRRGCRRIARYAFALAEQRGRSRVTIVHKANNLKLTEGMFLEEARAEAIDHPHIEVDDMLADTAAGTLVIEPGSFDVILTSNTFGDILSSVGAGVAGSHGLLASLNEGDDVVVAEAAHGSAASLAGSGSSNPLGLIAAGALLLERIGHPREGAAVAAGVRAVWSAGVLTPDLGGEATTSEVADEVAAAARAGLARQVASR